MHELTCSLSVGWPVSHVYDLNTVILDVKTSRPSRFETTRITPGRWRSKLSGKVPLAPIIKRKIMY